MKLETVGRNSDIKNQMTIDGMYIYLESKIGVRKSKDMATMKGIRVWER